MSKETRILAGFPSIFKAGNNTLITGLLKAIAQEDEAVALQYDEARDQLFVSYASAKHLNALGKNVGVTRPTLYPTADDTYRDIIPVLSYYPKNVKKTIYDLFDSYWGSEFTRSTVTARYPAPYSLSDGDQLKIKVDSDVALQTRTIPDISIYTVAAGSRIVKQGINVVSILFATDGVYAEEYHGTFLIDAADLGTLTVGNKITIDKLVTDPLDGYIKSIVPYLGYYAITIEIVNDPKEYAVTFNTDDFDDMLYCTLDEIIAVIDSYDLPIIASKYKSYNGKEYLRLNTKTTGGGGSIEVTDQPSLLGVDIMNFYEGKIQNARCSVYEINPNEIVVKIPDSIPMTCELRGANHFHVDATIYDTYPSDETAPYWPSSYIFDSPAPTRIYSVREIRTTTAQEIEAGQAYNQITVVDSLDFPEDGGYVMFDFGTDNEETLVPYVRRLSSSFLYLDAGYTFTKNHASGATMNLVNSSHFVPDVDGRDYAFYINNPKVAEALMTDLLELIKAAGVLVRFEVGGLTVSVNEFGPTFDIGWFGDACMTTVERNTMKLGWGLAERGRCWFNTTTNQWEGWNGAAVVIRG